DQKMEAGGDPVSPTKTSLAAQSITTSLQDKRHLLILPEVENLVDNPIHHTNSGHLEYFRQVRFSLGEEQTSGTGLLSGRAVGVMFNRCEIRGTLDSVLLWRYTIDLWPYDP